MYPDENFGKRNYGSDLIQDKTNKEYHKEDYYNNLKRDVNSIISYYVNSDNMNVAFLHNEIIARIVLDIGSKHHNNNELHPYTPVFKEKRSLFTNKLDNQVNNHLDYYKAIDLENTILRGSKYIDRKLLHHNLDRILLEYHCRVDREHIVDEVVKEVLSWLR